ncbi:MAG TPA: hypothetical protein VGK59_23755 [Ohtaekwangia sp.]
MKRILILFFTLASLATIAQTTESTQLGFSTSVKSGVTPAKVGAALDAIINGTKGDYIDGTATSTNTYAATITNTSMTSYNSGVWYIITFTNANTSTTCSINITSASALGAVPIKDNNGTDPAVGAIKAGGTYIMKYNGTHMRVMNFDDVGSSVTVATAAEVNTGTENGKYVSPSAFTTSKHPLESVSTITTGGTITLNFDDGSADDAVQKIFIGSASWSTPKTLAFSNASNTLVWNFHFEITNVAGTITCSTCIMNTDDPRWDSGTDTWQALPGKTGKYEATATYDGTAWKLKIDGPYN